MKGKMTLTFLLILLALAVNTGLIIIRFFNKQFDLATLDSVVEVLLVSQQIQLLLLIMHLT